MDNKITLHCAKIINNHNLIKMLVCRWLSIASALYASIYTVVLCFIFLYHRQLFLKAILIPFSTFLLITLLRKIIARPRPYEALSIAPLIKHSGEPSFPSRHTASAAIISCTVMQIHFAAGIILFIFSVFTGISRVMAGLHYPTDVGAALVISLLLQGFYFL